MAFGVINASRRKCPRRRARIGPKNYRAEMCRDGARLGGGGSGARHAGSGVIATVTTSGYLFIAPEAASTPSPMMPPKITLPAAMLSAFDGMMLDPSR
jgi:hypothetical protein